MFNSMKTATRVLRSVSRLSRWHFLHVLSRSSMCGLAITRNAVHWSGDSLGVNHCCKSIVSVHRISTITTKYSIIFCTCSTLVWTRELVSTRKDLIIPCKAIYHYTTAYRTSLYLLHDETQSSRNFIMYHQYRSIIIAYCVQVIN
jgi:hypothetical protein